MAPLDFKHFTSAKYRPGEDDAVNYYAQKRKKQYHGNEGKEVKELSMKPDKKLPNLKTPVKGKKGVSKFMRMKVHNQPYSSDYKKAMNASVQSADRKPEKYIKPDGKVGIRMVKTDKEIIKKESIDNHPKVKAARKAHAAGEWDGNVDKEGEAVVHINGKPHTVTNKYSQKKQSNPDRFKPFKKKTNEAVEYPHMMYDPKTGNEVKVKTPDDHNKYAKMGYTHEKPKVDEALNLQQRMKRSRLMKRMKSRIAIGRKRAMKKMANKKTIEKRAMRQARNDLAKKLTRGIPKADLTFARKQEIEKRLAKPALQQRIKRMAKKLFKDVRKKELERKKG